MPLLNLRVPVPEINPPDPAMVAAQATWATRTLLTFLPPKDRLLYYGGVGLMGMAGVLEWPVAAVAAAGVWVATRGQRSSRSAPAR